MTSLTGVLESVVPYKPGDNVLLHTNEPDDKGQFEYILDWDGATNLQHLIESIVNTGMIVNFMGEVMPPDGHYIPTFKIGPYNPVGG